MSGKLLIMAGLAVTFGATSYVAGNHYLESQTQARLDALSSNRPEIQEMELAKVVVATRELRFGEIIEEDSLKLVDWPKDAFPEGAFASLSDVVLDGERRVVTGIQPGEPVLAVKLTGENGRAGLAGIIAEGMRAVTIPVNTVNGVGGFVQPGDRVDLVLTKEDDETGETSAKIMMENVKVLTVDQEAGSRKETARVAKSVTLETDTRGAKRIALALNQGRISLLLRSAGDVGQAEAEDEGGGLLSFFESEPTTKSIRVVEGKEVTSYTVVIEKQEKDNKNNN
ncbi:MAG: Flp pilus assembly protein CpaB [Pseudomonadota bacterium]